MMQEYDDDFFFEEDKIGQLALFTSGIFLFLWRMWRSQIIEMYPFYDPRFGQPFITVNYNMYEDKIASKPAESNEINKNISLENNAAPITVQDQGASITNIESNDPYEDAIIIVEEQTDCVFNDMRRDRYMIRHQDLM